MERKVNLCAQVPASLHSRVREEQEKSGLTLSAYITQVLANYYEKGSEKSMAGTRTLAFQTDEALFQRLKAYLERESVRTGKKVNQKQFVLDLIRQALDEAERKEAECGAGLG